MLAAITFICRKTNINVLRLLHTVVIEGLITNEENQLNICVVFFNCHSNVYEYLNIANCPSSIISVENRFPMLNLKVHAR